MSDTLGILVGVIVVFMLLAPERAGSIYAKTVSHFQQGMYQHEHFNR